ncbi:MAG: DUF4249 domain-containing protein [Cyclobacteriaceae bacterium]|nr:DUF4249 domain-containing protein [Cyclobacteriaceae bacterium]
MRRGRYLVWLIIFNAIGACVERVEFDVPEMQSLLVVEGSITNELPPYTVKISRGFPVGTNSGIRSMVSNAQVTLFDDIGNQEILTEREPGIYITNYSIQGQVNHSYFIRIKTPDGQEYESQPERINPVGDISNIEYEFEARTKLVTYGEVDDHIFNIYVDANSGDAPEKYIRWRYTGTYEVITSPELHMTWIPPYRPYEDPWPCSGYIVGPAPGGSGTIIIKVGPCECCNCWVTIRESQPQLSDTQFIEGNNFKKVKVAEVPVTNATFYSKFKVEVEQMSLTRNAFDFFKLVRDQKENASSIFQPPSGEIRGNIQSLNGRERVVGLFWAAAVTKRTIYIYPEDVPLNLPPIDLITKPCYDFFKNATNQKPEGW